MSDKPICIDCKWCHKRWLDNPKYSQCYHPENVTVDLVTGKKTLKYNYCSSMRISTCGPSGKLFEPK